MSPRAAGRARGRERRALVVAFAWLVPAVACSEKTPPPVARTSGAAQSATVNTAGASASSASSAPAPGASTVLADDEPDVAPSASASPSALAGVDGPGVITAGCYEQKPQDFLIRGTYHPVRQHKPEHAKSIAYRATQYGVIPKLTPRDLNGHAPEQETLASPFMGLNVQLHRKIWPALRCVERQINKTCPNTYHPEILSGWRPKNTYHQGEISNHVFGIAIDVDPHKNPCCHCIEPWNNHPRCADRKATPYEHTELPRCWIESFERFGFYWLGQDKLEDTMHFEFLGDPDKIVPPKAKKAKP